jgi:hypothetical protein
MGFFDLIGKIPDAIGDFIDKGWQYAVLAGLVLLAIIFIIFKLFF